MNYLSVILSLFLFLTKPAFELQNKPQKPVEISFWKDIEHPCKDTFGIAVLFSNGFDSLYNFKISLNDSLLANFKTKTNESVNFCIYEDELAHVFLNTKYIKEGNILKVEIDHEYIEIPLTTNMKNYNTLIIDKYKKWKAAFKNSTRKIVLK